MSDNILQETTMNPIDAGYLEKAFDIDFNQNLNENFGKDLLRNPVVPGLVTAVDKEYVTVDTAMKTEGRIPLNEFQKIGEQGEVLDASNVPTVGDTINVFVSNFDNNRGEAVLSFEKALREGALDKIEDAFKKEESVHGVVFGQVKGGFMVDLNGILCFMPTSQLDSASFHNKESIMYTPVELKVVKFDRSKSNVIVSRRAAVDVLSDEDREKILADMHPGKVTQGTVKNLTQFGAFVDVGGIDALLHITDMAWHRVKHPRDLISVGQKIDVQILKYDEVSKRISVGMKQLQDDPWTTVPEQFPVGSRVTGKVTTMTDFGAFIQLSGSVEGMIHSSELSWTKKSVQPNKVLEMNQEVEVQVLEVDVEKRRIALGYKQCLSNPWDMFAKDYSAGTKVKGTIRSITDFGLFVGITDDIDGLVHMSDLDWDMPAEEALAQYKKGEEVEAQILSVDTEKERVALGIKQLQSDPMSDALDNFKRGQIVHVKVMSITADGLNVDLDGLEVFVRKRELAAERDQQDTSRFKEGEEVEMKVTTVSKRDRKLALSIRALEMAEEKEAMAEYAEEDEAGDNALAAALKKAGLKS